ncbi:cell division protein SepF [Polycladomyces abyssicola]|uniref:Cell division protein SepF n=1 Tax=Polycladomyces abyssicola TaxID=1125966 RepID=A0A8D5UHX8_9BACL|nr:cell division protein SepF [Polycladomyces abyssicola]BCU82237.1 cell division protein SepF [Polycladomyces abyssicola]
MSFIQRVMNFFGITEDDVVEYHEEDAESVSTRERVGHVVSLHTQKNIRVMLIEPRTYEDAQEIADNIKSHRPVVVNLQRVGKDQAVRIVDFLSGTVYALGGNIQKLGPNIFMCTPANVDVQGTISDLVSDDAKELLR